MIAIGISSNACMDRPLDEALELLSARVRFVEVMSGGRQSLFDYGDVLPSFSLRYSVHCPVSDGNLSEPKLTIRKASVQVIVEIAAVCDWERRGHGAAFGILSGTRPVFRVGTSVTVNQSKTWEDCRKNLR